MNILEIELHHPINSLERIVAAWDELNNKFRLKVNTPILKSELPIKNTKLFENSIYLSNGGSKLGNDAVWLLPREDYMVCSLDVVNEHSAHPYRVANIGVHWTDLLMGFPEMTLFRRMGCIELSMCENGICRKEPGPINKNLHMIQSYIERYDRKRKTWERFGNGNCGYPPV